jgi:glutathione S-transferase
VSDRRSQVQTGSFVLRYMTHGKHGLMSPNVVTELQKQAPNFYKWANAVIVEKSVNHIWDEEGVIKATKAKMARMAAESK